jgi:hypothetical protein
MPKSLGLSPEEKRARKKYQLFKKDLKKYGITPEEFWARFEAQGRKCACCSSKSYQGRGWCVDHDHASGHVRGILCGKCNLGIGQLGDTAASVRKAYEYLIRTSQLRLA